MYRPLVWNHSSYSTFRTRVPVRKRKIRRESVRPIYVRNLAPDVDRARLAEAFAEYGKIKEVRVAAFLETGLNRGHGYVIFTDEKATVLALEHANGKEVNGQSIQVEPRIPRKIRDPVVAQAKASEVRALHLKKEAPSRTIWLKLRDRRGLRASMTMAALEQSLRGACRAFGTVARVRFIYGTSDREKPRSVEVTFTALQAAVAAREALAWPGMLGKPGFVILGSGGAAALATGDKRGGGQGKKSNERNR